MAIKIRTIKPKTKKQIKDKHEGEMLAYEDLPSFSIDLEHLPEAKKWEIGGEYTLALKVKQTGINQEKTYGRANFDIVGIGIIKKGLSKKQEKISQFMTKDPVKPEED